MLRERQRWLSYWVWTADLATTALAFVLAWWLRSHLGPRLLPGLFPTELYPLGRYLGLLPLVLLLWTALLVTREAYTARRGVSVREEAWQLAQVVALGTLGLAATGWALRLDFVSRPFLALFALLDLLALVGERLAVRRLAGALERRGLGYRRLLVVGLGPRAREVAAILDAHPGWGLELVGFVAADGEGGETAAGRPVLGRLEELERILRREVVDEVLFAVAQRDLERLEEPLLVCAELGVRARVALPLPRLASRVLLEELEGIPLLTFASSPAAPFPLFLKRLMDLTVAVAGLLLLAPLMGLVAAAIRLTSPGPALFRQVRCGLNGRRFVLYKFRTMYADAEARLQEVAHLNEVRGPAFKARRDPRVTPLGRILRRLSLDELPQLINVLKGDMSLVGPRPPLPEEVARYERWQRRRLAMKPGLTGLWQVSGRAEIADFDRWTQLDLAYIDHWSLWLDLKILLRTLPAVLSTRGAA